MFAASKAKIAFKVYMRLLVWISIAVLLGFETGTLHVEALAAADINATSNASPQDTQLANAADAGQGLDSRKLWQELLPRIQAFWKEDETSSHMAAATVWPLIRELKRFVQLFPDSPYTPQCYYILGEAYASVSFLPEALAHWKIVAKHYPQSPWASEALMAILLNLERQGNTKEIRKLYREIVSQFSDSTAARAAWVIMSLNSLNAKNAAEIARQIDIMESRRPGIYVKVPQILDLKARIAELQGREKEARGYWLHYMNLIRSKAQRAATLFRIAESYRNDAQLIRAGKYYNVLKRNYASQPESFFAAFRLSQLKRAYRERLSPYVPGLPPAVVDSETIRLYREIIKRFPRHPLTQEVELELMRALLNQGKFTEAIELAQDFLHKNPRSSLTPAVIKTGFKAIESLETENANKEGLKRSVEYSIQFIRVHPQSPFKSRMSRTAQILWGKYVKSLFNSDMFAEALEQAWAFERAFPGTVESNQASKLAEKALLALDQEFLAGRHPLDLLNYYYDHKSFIQGMRLPGHHFFAARAWKALRCANAALREFFKAWSLGPGKDETENLLRLWADTALEAGDLATARAVLGLYPDPDKPEALKLAARLAAFERDWPRVKMLSERFLRAGAGDKKSGFMLGMLFTSCVNLGDWKRVKGMWPELAPLLDPEEKIRLLRLWGDAAFEKNNYSVAMFPYSRLMTLEPEAPEVSWRVALSHLKMGKTSVAMEELKALTQGKEEPWSTAAMLLLANETFWQGPAGALLDAEPAMNL